MFLLQYILQYDGCWHIYCGSCNGNSARAFDYPSQTCDQNTTQICDNIFDPVVLVLMSSVMAILLYCNKRTLSFTVLFVREENQLSFLLLSLMYLLYRDVMKSTLVYHWCDKHEHNHER